MHANDLLALVRGLQRHDLERWLERGWIRPSQDGDIADYRAADVARIRLICELRQDMAVNDEGIGVALDLLDQLYGTRAQLHALGRAVLQQPEQVRREIEALMRDLMEA
jgi:chaperone modulatory protein CbpM